jgi:hypothetical protein
MHYILQRPRYVRNPHTVEDTAVVRPPLSEQLIAKSNCCLVRLVGTGHECLRSEVAIVLFECDVAGVRVLSRKSGDGLSFSLHTIEAHVRIGITRLALR